MLGLCASAVDGNQTHQRYLELGVGEAWEVAKSHPLQGWRPQGKLKGSEPSGGTVLYSRCGDGKGRGLRLAPVSSMLSYFFRLY